MKKSKVNTNIRNFLLVHKEEVTKFTDELLLNIFDD